MFQEDVTFSPGEITNAAALSDRQEIQEFYVHQDKQEFSASRVLAILDGIFWTCPPLTITQWNPYHYDFVKLQFEMLELRSGRQNSNFQGTKFWQRDLKEVKEVEIFRYETSSQNRTRTAAASNVVGVGTLLESLRNSEGKCTISNWLQLGMENA